MHNLLQRLVDLTVTDFSTKILAWLFSTAISLLPQGLMTNFTAIGCGSTDVF